MDKDKRIKELEKEVVELKQCLIETQLPRGNMKTIINKVVNFDRLKELLLKQEQKLKNVVIPKFRYKQFVYALYTNIDVIKGQIESYDYYSRSYLIFFGDDVGSDWIVENLVFRTKKQAEQKIKN